MALHNRNDYQLGLHLIVVGVNCHFDPFVALETMKKMKQGLQEAGLLDKVYLMCQPLAYHTPDAGRQGFIDLPEFPFSLEPRVCTRWDIQKYARQAYELGIRYTRSLIINCKLSQSHS